MKIINCKKIADNILAKLKQKIQEKNIKPRLAIILIGNNSASHLYVKIKEKTGQSIGIEIEKHFLSDRIKEEEIINLINSLNKDNRIDGILVQLPLPRGLSADKIIKEISVNKDVDGFLPESKFDSAFILAIYETIKATEENLKDKKIIALVNSNIFGEKLVNFFKEKELIINIATDLELKQADIIITALGQPEIIKGDMIKKGVVLIDGGISKIDDKIIGDIDIESVKNKAKWLSPVPGGIGPFKNVIQGRSLKYTSFAKDVYFKERP